jgi:peptidoglycan/xylan/chitin deacetylase (PgdA/CDA1 family)
MYHSISDAVEDGVSPYYRVCTRPQAFADQMQWLADNGYQAMTLSKGLNLLPQLKAADHGPRTTDSGSQPVVLTFDDGFRDFHTHAFPVLQKHGFSATMFLPTAFIGETRRVFSPSPRRGEVPSLAGAGEGGRRPDEGRRDRTDFSGRGEVNPSSSSGRECLTWSEVKELHHAGIEFGSHTVNHPTLVDLSWDQIKLEIQNSKLEIEAQLSVPCPTFAYPYAFPSADAEFVKKFTQLLNDAGYACGVTTGIGRIRPGDAPFTLKRLPVNTCDDLPLFAAKLAGAYDWLAVPQEVVKKLKRLKGNPNQKLGALNPKLGT